MKPEQEALVSEAFSRQAVGFDDSDIQNPILQWMRKEVRNHVLSILKKGDTILELNAGTGLDAVYFAQQGFHVLATDNAEGMIYEIQKKIASFHLEENLKAERCSFNNLSSLQPMKFDAIFSNFGGLNCADDLPKVIQQFDDLLNPDGTVTLVIMPPVCPWELLYMFKVNFKLALRRLNKNGTKSHLEGVYFNTYYYSPSYVKQAFGKGFKMLHLQGIGSISPPPYMEKFAINNPKIYKALSALDSKLGHLPPFQYWADHYIISFKKL